MEDAASHGALDFDLKSERTMEIWSRIPHHHVPYKQKVET